MTYVCRSARQLVHPSWLTNTQGAYKLSEGFVIFVSTTHSERYIWSKTMFTSHHFQRHYQDCESASTPQSGTSHKTCLRGVGGNGSIAWMSAVSHLGRTSNVFNVTMKLQTFFFQMVVTSCISVQYLWKYGFVKYSDNWYPLCISTHTLAMARPMSFLRLWVLDVGFYVGDIEQVSMAVI
jgi:hypothetical protein